MKKLVSKLARLPEKPGVYLIRDEKTSVIYISKTSNIKEEILSFLTDTSSRRNITIRKSMVDIDFEIIDNELEATKRELELIKYHNPPLNGRRKGLKQYRFVNITTNEKFPRVRKKKIIEDDETLFLGPFPKNRHIQRVISIAANYYSIADCGKEIVLGDDHKIVKTCIRRQTNQCMKPCEVEIDEIQYKEAIDEFIKFFRGQDDSLIRFLRTEMERAVEEKQFTKAAKLRDDQTSIKKVLKDQ